MESFLNGSQAIAFAVATSKDERYQFIEALLRRFSYARLKRHEKGIMIQCLMKVSAYSRQQLTRMIQRYTHNGKLERFQKTAHGFEQHYTVSDILLLAKLDQRYDTPNGFVIKKLCERAYHIFDDAAYERLSCISVSHIYNLRQSSEYKNYRCHYEKTK